MYIFIPARNYFGEYLPNLRHRTNFRFCCVKMKSCEFTTQKCTEKFHPGIASRVHLRYTCANCIALKPRAIWITWFAKVNFVFQFDCNRGSSVRARRDANCSLRGGSYELVVKLNFCSLNSFGIIISWHRASLRACFFHVRCIIAKFDVYEFLTLSTRFISGII